MAYDYDRMDAATITKLKETGHVMPLCGNNRIGDCVATPKPKKQQGRGENQLEVTVKFTQRIRINGWHPTPLNKLIGVHWATASKRKKSDRQVISQVECERRLRWASGHRRVKLTIFLEPRQRAADPDAYWKSLLDALVHSKLLIDDSRTHCTLGGVEFCRAKEAATVIELEDMQPQG